MQLQQKNNKNWERTFLRFPQSHTAERRRLIIHRILPLVLKPDRSLYYYYYQQQQPIIFVEERRRTDTILSIHTVESAHNYHHHHKRGEKCLFPPFIKGARKGLTAFPQKVPIFFLEKLSQGCHFGRALKPKTCDFPFPT